MGGGAPDPFLAAQKTGAECFTKGLLSGVKGAAFLCPLLRQAALHLWDQA